MKIDTARLAGFVGGQLEIQNSGEGYLLRGEIEKVEIKGKGDSKEVQVVFAWVAKNDGTPSRPSPGWSAESRLDYQASLMLYTFSDIGNNRLCLNSSIVGELCVFYPKGYKNDDGEECQLERSRVKGL